MDEEEAGTTRIREFAGWYGCMCVCQEGRERCERWRKDRGLARPHAVNTPQRHRNVTGLSSETFASNPVSLRFLLALFPRPHPYFLNSRARKSRNFAPRPNIACKYAGCILFHLQIPLKGKYTLDKKRRTIYR